MNFQNILFALVFATTFHMSICSPLNRILHFPGNDDEMFNNVTPIKQKLFSVSSSGRVTKPCPLPHKPLKMTYYLGVIDKRVFVPMIYFVINSFSNGKQLNHI